MIFLVFQSLQGAFLTCGYAVLDYAQTGLIAAVFFFKVSNLVLQFRIAGQPLMALL